MTRGDPDDPLGFVPSHKVRIFPNRPDIRFTGRIHETVEAALVAAAITIVDRDEPVHHFGMLNSDPEKASHYAALSRLKVRDEPGNAAAWSELADALDAGGDRQGAREAIEQAWSLSRLPRHRLTAGIWNLQAGDLEGAEDRLVGIDSAELASTELAECQHARAQIAIRRGRPAAAAPLLASALRLAPHDGFVWNTLGVMLLHMGKGEQARRALQRARTLLPGHPEPLANLAILNQTNATRRTQRARRAAD